MVQVFAAAGVVIGLAGIGRAPLDGGRVTDTALIVALAAYAVAAVLTIWQRHCMRHLHFPTPLPHPTPVVLLPHRVTEPAVSPATRARYSVLRPNAPSRRTPRVAV